MNGRTWRGHLLFAHGTDSKVEFSRNEIIWLSDNGDLASDGHSVASYLPADPHSTYTLLGWTNSHSKCLHRHIHMWAYVAQEFLGKQSGTVIFSRHDGTLGLSRPPLYSVKVECVAHPQRYWLTPILTAVSLIAADALKLLYISTFFLLFIVAKTLLRLL